LADLQAECMNALPLAAMRGQSLFVDRSGRVLLSGTSHVDWAQQESQAPGSQTVFVPTAAAAAVPDIRSVACAGVSSGYPIVLTTDGKVFTDGSGVAGPVPGTVRFLSADDEVIFADPTEGGLYWWSLNPSTTTSGDPWPPDKPTRHDKGSLGRARVQFLAVDGGSCFAVGDNGMLASWGTGPLGLGGARGEEECVMSPARINGLNGVAIRSVAVGLDDSGAERDGRGLLVGRRAHAGKVRDWS
jgi:hypothetical protein